MSLTFYGYSRCGTCRNAAKWLASKSIAAEIVDLVQTPPSAEKLSLLVEQSGLDIRKFFNTSGEAYRDLQLKDKLPSLSREEQLELLAGNGKLIKRPIVTDGSRVTVGFKEEEFERVWGK